MISKLVKDHKLNYWQLAMVLGGLCLLIVGKDLAHAAIKNYVFYWSESLLFGSFWLCFVPLIILNFYKKIPSGYFTPLLFSLLHIGLFALIVFLVSFFCFNHTFEFGSTFIHTVCDQGITCLLIYSLSNLIAIKNQDVSKPHRALEEVCKINVTTNNKTTAIALESILYVKAEKPYIALVTKEKTYLYNSTLKQFLGAHATAGFIQIHKSTLVNRHEIVAFTSRKNGDYDLEMSNQQSVRASRSYKNNFKSCLDRLSLG